MKGLKPALITAVAIGLMAGSAVGIAAQDEEPAQLETPLYYTWRAGIPATQIDGTVDESTGEMRGLVQEAIPVEASDPRLSGLAYIAANGNAVEGANGFGALESRSYRLVTEDGSWTGSGTFVVADGPAEGPPEMVREAMLLTGEGAYEGLVVFVTGDYRDSATGEAVVLRVAPPPVPDVPDVPAE